MECNTLCIAPRAIGIARDMNLLFLMEIGFLQYLNTSPIWTRLQGAVHRPTESATFHLHCFFACSNCFLSFQSKSSVLQISKRYALLVFWKMKPKWNQTRTKFKCDFLYAGHLWILIVLHNLSVWEVLLVWWAWISFILQILKNYCWKYCR